MSLKCSRAGPQAHVSKEGASRNVLFQCVGFSPGVLAKYLVPISKNILFVCVISALFSGRCFLVLYWRSSGKFTLFLPP